MSFSTLWLTFVLVILFFCFIFSFFFFLRIRRPPRSTLDRSSAASDVYKRQEPYRGVKLSSYAAWWIRAYILRFILNNWRLVKLGTTQAPVSYTHLRAHETVLDIVCRLLLEKTTHKRPSDALLTLTSTRVWMKRDNNHT